MKIIIYSNVEKELDVFYNTIEFEFKIETESDCNDIDCIDIFEGKILIKVLKNIVDKNNVLEQQIKNVLKNTLDNFDFEEIKEYLDGDLDINLFRAKAQDYLFDILNVNIEFLETEHAHEI